MFVGRPSFSVCPRTRDETSSGSTGPVDAPVVITPLGVSEQFRPRARTTDRRQSRSLRRKSRPLQGLQRRSGGVRAGCPGAQRPEAPGRWGWQLQSRGRRRDCALGPKKFRVRRDVLDDDLPDVLAEATIFVAPSRYEGFGLTVLEAMACGTPTILANASSFPEVGGVAAAYFTPGDSSELAARITKLLGDPDLRRRCHEEGLIEPARSRGRTPPL